jgi:hypothetical protein
LHFEEHLQLTRDRGQQLRRAAEADRLARQTLGRRQGRRRRSALDSAFELLLRGRRRAGQSTT